MCKQHIKQIIVVNMIKKKNSNSLLDCIIQQCVIVENKKYISDIAPCKKSKKLKETHNLKINK